jgi:hypothetical protein
VLARLTLPWSFAAIRLTLGGAFKTMVLAACSPPRFSARRAATGPMAGFAMLPEVCYLIPSIPQPA